MLIINLENSQKVEIFQQIAIIRPISAIFYRRKYGISKQKGTFRHGTTQIYTGKER